MTFTIWTCPTDAVSAAPPVMETTTVTLRPTMYGRARLAWSGYKLFRVYDNGRIESALKTLGLIKPYCYSWRERRRRRSARGPERPQ